VDKVSDCVRINYTIVPKTSLLPKTEVKAANKQVSNVLYAVYIRIGFFVMAMAYKSLGFHFSAHS